MCKVGIVVREIQKDDIAAAAEIWNKVVEDGRAFPQTETLTVGSAEEFFGSQSYTAAACDEETGVIAGLYILHPNNIGRCGHMANASYAVRTDLRGMHIGEALVTDCIRKSKELGFRLLVFNAVVKSNTAALALYKKIGFTQLGIIPGGFLNRDGVYEDIIPHYIEL